MTINSISKSVLATALLCVMVPVAFAADMIDVKTVSSWGTPVAILQQDAFAYCSVENSYDNGMRLIFARNALGRTNIAIGFPDARLKVGSSYPLHLSVDDRLSRDVFGTALAADVLVIPTQDDDDLYQAIRRGMYMRIDGSDDSISFHLAGTSRALAALGRCVTVEVAKSPAPPPVQAPVAFVPTVAPVPVPPAETVVVERSGSGGMRAPMVETADLESALPPVEEPAVVAPDPVVIESIESVETEEPVVVEEPMETVVIAIEEDVQVETATRMPIAPVAAPMLEPEPVAEPAAVPEPVAAPMLEPEPVAAPMLEPEPVAAPVAEPVAVPEQIAEPVSTPVITEQVAEPVPATVYYDKVWVERIFDEMFDDGTIVPDFIDLAGMSRQRPVDIAWRVDGILGGIKVYRVDETVSLNELAGTYVEWLRPNCQGNFSENLSPISDNVMTADAICGTDDSMAALALRRNGDTLAIVFHEGQGMETIDYVRKLRDALATYMVE